MSVKYILANSAEGKNIFLSADVGMVTFGKLHKVHLWLVKFMLVSTTIHVYSLYTGDILSLVRNCCKEYLYYVVSQYMVNRSGGAVS